VRVLVTRDSEGWTLPAVEHEDNWFAHEACAVARDLGNRLGMHLTALREMEKAGLRLCELENHTPPWRPPPGARWVDRAQARTLPLHPPGQRALLHAWFRQARRRPPATRAPWECKGWYEQALGWIEEQLARLGYTQAGAVVQLKTAWTCSSILRVPTTAGDLYFKADYARPPAEGAVIAELARRWQRHVPRLLAADDSRRWMLTEDFGPCGLTQLPFGRWLCAIRLFARLQRECSTELERWSQMGCPDRRLERLIEHLDPLLADPILARADPPDRLSAEEMRQLHGRRGELKQECLELAGSGPPVSFVQQDFRDGNVAVRGRDYIFYDWSDTVLSHPFFSACRFLDYVGSHGRKDGRRLPTAVRHERLREAYLEPWAPYGSRRRLREVFQRARRLNPLYQAVRWYLELPYCEPGTPGWRDTLGSVTCSLKNLLQSWRGA
jgi:hypothetical protein